MQSTCERTSTLITASTTEINRKITCLQWPVSGRPQWPGWAECPLRHGRPPLLEQSFNLGSFLSDCDFLAPQAYSVLGCVDCDRWQKREHWPHTLSANHAIPLAAVRQSALGKNVHKVLLNTNWVLSDKAAKPWKSACENVSTHQNQQRCKDAAHRCKGSLLTEL